MAKPEWGVKRVCDSCGTRFYDFRKPEIVCPKCGTAVSAEVKKPKKKTPANQDKEDIQKKADQEAENAVKELGDDDDDSMLEDDEDMVSLDDMEDDDDMDDDDVLLDDDGDMDELDDLDELDELDDLDDDDLDDDFEDDEDEDDDDR